jgi:tRNA/tmRNA/rRNA uracil-C5-methylase (TrmA/RlmC/RlmD family)
VAGAEVVVVDPPRKGLDPKVLAVLADPSCTATRLLYLSCG